MGKVLNELWRYLKFILRSKYKWLLILYTVWLYRINFMPADSGGLGQQLQVVTTFGILFFVGRYSKWHVFKWITRTNIAITSMYILYLFATISVIWAFLPMFSFFMSIQNVILIALLVWAFAHVRNFKTAEKSLVLLALYTALFESIVARIITPGLIKHLLATASCAAMVFSYCMAEYIAAGSKEFERKSFLRGGIIISLIILVVSTSGGANASAVFGMGIGFMFSKRKMYAILLMAAGFALWMNQDIIDDLILALMPGKTMEVVENGNGRESIWNAIMEVAQEKPVIGWGFACAERVVADKVFEDQLLMDAHNSYIGIYGGLGIIGLIMLLFHVLSALFVVFKKRLSRGFAGLLAAICCASINSYSFGFLSGKACSITVVYFAIVIMSYYYTKVTYDGK